MRPKSPGAVNGGMMKRHKHFSAPIITIQVDDITRSLKSIEKKVGKTIVKRTKMGQYGAYGYFKDTEGNVVGLFEEPKV
jgi:uncharacterized protein